MLRITAATSPSGALIPVVDSRAEDSPPAPTGIGSAAALNSLNYSVAILDRDAVVLASLSRLVRTAGYAVRTFSTARAFLAEHDPTVPGCSILDLSISGMGGLQLQAELTARGSRQPVIFITRKADVRASVQAMKAGAVDVLTQPVDEDALLAALACAAEREAKERRRNVELASISARLAKLTPRESEVLRGVVVGRLNKQIAASLGVAEKTVKVHRGRMMRKMAVRSLLDLVRLTELANCTPEPTPPSRMGDLAIADLAHVTGRAGEISYRIRAS